LDERSPCELKMFYFFERKMIAKDSEAEKADE